MMMLVALLAILLGVARWGYVRYFSPTLAKVYYIGDLIDSAGRGVQGTPAGTSASLNTALAAQARALKNSITPDVWWFGNRSVRTSVPGNGLIVVHTPEGQRTVADWIKQRRDCRQPIIDAPGVAQSTIARPSAAAQPADR
jgi:hypothetical protein